MPKHRGAGLTPKQERFCREYLVDRNGAAAARRAGFAEKNAKHAACELLQKPGIRALILSETEKQNRRLKISADRVKRELVALALWDPKDFVHLTCPADIELLPAYVRRAIVGFGYDRNGNFEVKLDKARALELLGRHFKMFTDKHEHGGKVKLTLEDLVGGSMAGQPPDTE